MGGRVGCEIDSGMMGIGEESEFGVVEVFVEVVKEDVGEYGS